MITKEISIKGASLRSSVLTQLEQKAMEFNITGGLTRNADGSATLVSTGSEPDVINYLNWFENISTQHGFRPQVRNTAFKAFYKFSVS